MEEYRLFWAFLLHKHMDSLREVHLEHYIILTFLVPHPILQTPNSHGSFEASPNASNLSSIYVSNLPFDEPALSELGMRAIKDEVAKNSILMYDPKTVGHTYNDISELVAKVKSICECEVEHLPSVQSLILHYKDSAHLPASAFSFNAGIVYADEDEMIMPPDDEDEGNDDEADRYISEVGMHIEKIDTFE